MLFKVEVEDFWLDDADLATELRAHIKRDVVHQIANSIKEQTEKQITEAVREAVDSKIKSVIHDTICELITTGVIIHNRQEITIEQHIKNVFMSNTGWSNPRSAIEKFAKEFGAELKKQYNAFYANQIVVSMKEQGFLKDDVVQMLINKATD